MPKGAKLVQAEDLDDPFDDDEVDDDELEIANTHQAHQLSHNKASQKAPSRQSKAQLQKKSSSSTPQRKSNHSKGDVQQFNRLTPRNLDEFVPKARELNEESTAGMNEVTLVVLGHVDAGKSTLIGRLITDTQTGGQKKQTRTLAWHMDQRKDERDRGITMDLGVAQIKASSVCITVLDAPGHKDFVPRAISGSLQADCALLVVDASPGEFETGISSGGQTREHIQLAYTMSVQQLVVAVNKLDRCDNPIARYDKIVATIATLLERYGFGKADCSYVAVSALHGTNVVSQEASEAFGLTQKHNLQSLHDALSQLNVPERAVNKPLRFLVADAAQGSSNLASSSTTAASGRIESGALAVGDTVLLMPSGTKASVKAIEAHGQTRVKQAIASAAVDITLDGLGEHDLAKGSVLCDPAFPVPMATELKLIASVADDATMPVLQGTSVVAYIGFVEEPATVTKLYSVLDEAGNVKKRDPKALPRGATGELTIMLERAVPAEHVHDCAKLGRVVLREKGYTLMLASVESINQQLYK